MKRYWQDGMLHESERGDLVFYSAVAEMEAAVAKMEAENARLKVDLAIAHGALGEVAGEMAPLRHAIIRRRENNAEIAR